MTATTLYLQNCEIDEALWSAYRRDDKAAVMDYLFRRTFIGISRSRWFPQLLIKASPKRRLAARRAQCESLRINSGARQIGLRYSRSLRTSKIPVAASRLLEAIIDGRGDEL
jgi:hypothetical protein